MLHDRDNKFCVSFPSALESAGVKPIMLPPKSPNLNAYAERWVRSVKQECLSKLVLFGEGPLQRSLTEFTAHYHLEHNHQGKDNQLLTPLAVSKGRKIRCHQRLAGLKVLCPRRMNILALRPVTASSFIALPRSAGTPLVRPGLFPGVIL